MDNKTFHIFTFGCQMNMQDSGWITRALLSSGWEKAPADKARVLLLNTCSVREKPEKKVYSLVGRLKAFCDKDPDKLVAVGGCVAQQLGEKLLEQFSHVRLVFGTDQTVRVPEALETLLQNPEERLSIMDFEDRFTLRDLHLTAQNKGIEAFPVTHLPGQAFVNIMQGCNNFCAYCIVPFVRGPQKSRPTTDILNEVKILVQKGVREITLLGQNVNSFGLDKHGDGTSFASLLHQVGEISGLSRLRFTTSHPKDLAPEVIESFKTLPVLCPCLHLPLQAGSDTLLQAMGRGYTIKHYMGLVSALRRARPDIALTTDIITGFPGETEHDFQKTLDIVEQVNFISSFSFVYSDRPGTRSVTIEPKIDKEVALDRLKRLQGLQTKLTEKDLTARLKAECTLLLEGPSKKQGYEREKVAWQGRDEQGRVVNVITNRNMKLKAGMFLPVRIVQAKKHSLMAETAGNPW